MTRQKMQKVLQETLQAWNGAATDIFGPLKDALEQDYPPDVVYNCLTEIQDKLELSMSSEELICLVASVLIVHLNQKEKN